MSRIISISTSSGLKITTDGACRYICFSMFGHGTDDDLTFTTTSELKMKAHIQSHIYEMTKDIERLQNLS